MGAPPLKPTRGAAAEEEVRILGRELVVLKQEPALQTLALDLRVLLLRQAGKRVLLDAALRTPADLGPGTGRRRAGTEPFESEPHSTQAAAGSILLTAAHAESNPAASERIAESDVDVAAEAPTTAGREADVRSARAADGVSFGFNPRGSRAVRVESLDGAGSAEAGAEHVCDRVLCQCTAAMSQSLRCCQPHSANRCRLTRLLLL